VDSQANERVTDSVGGGEETHRDRLVPASFQDLTVTNLTNRISKSSPSLIVSYTNTGKAQLQILGWSNNAYQIDAQRSAEKVAFWSFQSGSYERRPKLGAPDNTLGSLSRTNLGMKRQRLRWWNPDRRCLGAETSALGSATSKPGPRLISLPVFDAQRTPGSGSVCSYRHNQSLQPGESFHTFRTFVTVTRRRLLSDAAYLPPIHVEAGISHGLSPGGRLWKRIWLCLGIRAQLPSPNSVYDTASHRQEDGIQMGDARRRLAEQLTADWQLDPKKFPRGDADIKAMVDRNSHQEGFKAQLWWSPLRRGSELQVTFG